MENLHSMATAPTSAPAQEQPRFEEGFTLKTLIGAFFIALFMLPGGIYLGLVAGQGVGEAAEWVTIVLFAEVARRSFMPLRKQEVYILFYIAASLTTVINATRGLGGGPFANLIWNAYFVTTEQAQPILQGIPSWAVPNPSSPAIVERNLWHGDWWSPGSLQFWSQAFWKPALILIVTEICSKLSWIGMGYALFRVTSDVEKLPFPYAPVAASGATALAEAGTESWRWSVFSAGSVVGMLFGLVYVALPVISGMLFGYPVEVLPIPFADYTRVVENLLPAAVIGLSFSLGNVLVGFVLPYHIVLGATAASVLTMIVANPILHGAGLLPSYRFGSGAFMTKLAADMDIWLSVTIGINIAIALIGIALVIKATAQARRYREERKYSLAPPEGRGDFPIYTAVLVWLGATITLIWLSHVLIPDFPVWLLCGFGLFWSPFNSYISARLQGLTGRTVGLPFLREAAVVATGYQRTDVWYAPIPLWDHGAVSQRFREVELTGTKFTSILKAEALMLPLTLVFSFLFWAFFWKTSPVPSNQFPYAQRFWPIEATVQSVFQQVNLPKEAGETNFLLAALKPSVIGMGATFGLAFYGICSFFKLPLLFFYGFAGGIAAYPANTIPQLFGAWFGRKYMRKRYGEENWARYAPVLLAGFSCGTGLVAMASIALVLVGKAVTQLPY